MLTFGKLCVHFLNTLQAIQLIARLFLFEFEIPFLLTLLHLQLFGLQARIQVRLHQHDARLAFGASYLKVATDSFQFLFMQDAFPLIVPRLAEHFASPLNGRFDAVQLLLTAVCGFVFLPLDFMLPFLAVLSARQAGQVLFLLQGPHLHGIIQINAKFA